MSKKDLPFVPRHCAFVYTKHTHQLSALGQNLELFSCKYCKIQKRCKNFNWRKFLIEYDMKGTKVL